MVKSAVARRISVVKAMAATSRLEAEALKTLRDAQYNYITEKLKERPELCVKVIAVLDGISNPRSNRKRFISQSIRKFGQLPKVACHSTIEELVKERLTSSSSFAIDAIPLANMRFLIVWCLFVEPTLKIPQGKRERDDFIQWAAARHKACRSPLASTFRLPWQTEDLLFIYGVFIIVKPADYDTLDESTVLDTIRHSASGKEATLPPQIEVTKKELHLWVIVNNHNQELAQLENSSTGISYFLKRLFGEGIADEAPAVLLF